MCTKRYVPGNPGCSWSEDQLVFVRQHLDIMFQDDISAEKMLKELPKGPITNYMKDTINQFREGQNVSGSYIVSRYKNSSPLRNARRGEVEEENGIPGIREAFNAHHSVIPNLPKVVRLAFHDCIRHSDASEGCNGCLNFEGMGGENPGAFYLKDCTYKEDVDCPKDHASEHTNNNNMFWTARVLEQIYTNVRPKLLPTSKKHKLLQRSLRDSGISRSDLWAYAGLVAIHKAIEHHNKNCNRGNGEEGLCRNQINENSDDCTTEIPNIVFKYGRIDCKPTCKSPLDNLHGFCDGSEEKHPNPHGNGKDTTDFFKESFGLTKKEAITLMGAHTLGSLHERVSDFHRYSWVQGGKHELNNEYYQVMALKYKGISQRGTYRKWMKPERVGCIWENSHYMGDEQGNPWNATWLIFSKTRQNDGGPFLWLLSAEQCDLQLCDQLYRVSDDYPYWEIPVTIYNCLRCN